MTPDVGDCSLDPVSFLRARLQRRGYSRRSSRKRPRFARPGWSRTVNRGQRLSGFGRLMEASKCLPMTGNRRSMRGDVVADRLPLGGRRRDCTRDRDRLLARRGRIDPVNNSIVVGLPGPFGPR